MLHLGQFEPSWLQCVYLSQNADDGWFIYDMETGFISPGFAATSLPWNEPVLEE